MKKFRLSIETTISEYDDADPTIPERVITGRPNWSLSASFNSLAEADRHAEFACKEQPPSPPPPPCKCDDYFEHCEVPGHFNPKS